MNEASPKPSTPYSKLEVGTLTYTKVGLAMTSFWLLLGSFAWALKGRAGQPIVENLLNDFGAADAYAGALVGAFPAVIAVLFFPLLGYLSDRYRSPWGRRVPFLLMAMPFFVVATVGLAFSPWLGTYLNPSDHGGTVITCVAAFWAVFSFSEILGNTIFAALINDVIPPTVIGRFFGLYRAASLLGGILFNYYLFHIAQTQYTSILLGVAVFTTIAIALLCLNVREGKYPPAPPDPKGWQAAEHEAKNYLQDCFGSPFYILLFIVWALGTTACNPINYYVSAFSSAYITHTEYASLYVQTYIISLILAYPLGVLADRYHPLRLSIVALALYALAMLWAGFFAKTSDTFAIAFLLHGVLFGVYLTVSASLLQRLFPRAKFAQFATTAGAVVCLWNIAIVPFAGTLLGPTGRDSTSIFLLTSLLGGLGVIAGIVLLRWFKARGGDRNYVPTGEDFKPFIAPDAVYTAKADPTSLRS